MRARMERSLVLVVVLAAGCWTLKQNVTGEEAHRLVAGGALLLDVRSPEEFKSGHIEGAVNIPVQDLETRMAEVGPKDKPVVVYCHSGMRAAHAAELLERAGYSSVRDLGPMSRW